MPLLLKKEFPILVIKKNGFPQISSGHHMVKASLKLHSNNSHQWEECFQAPPVLLIVTSISLTPTSRYDALGRLLATTNPLGVLDFTYEDASERLLAASGSGHPLDAHYSYFGNAHARRLQSMEYRNAQQAVVQANEYQYSPGGNIIRWQQTRSAHAAREWELEYDPISQLTAGVRRELTPAGVLETVRYDYDAGWNRTRKVQNQNVNAFTFTTGNELISEVSRGLTTISGTTDIASRVTVNAEPATEGAFATAFGADLDLPEGTHEIEVVALAENSFTMTTQKWEVESVNTAERTLSYDTLGNLVSDGERTYEWDAENRLVAVEIDEVSRSEFAYDGLSRRVGVTEKVWDSNSSSFIIQTSAFYLWDGLEIAEERDASGAVLKRYFGQGEERLHPSTLILEPFYYLRDHLGSVTGVVDASGTMLVEYGYGLWGERTVLSGSVSSDFGFTGHFTHKPSGLVLAPYRAYDPDTARWLSRDPIGEAGGINLYGYVLNDAVNLIDPTGEAAFAPVLLLMVRGAAIGAMAGGGLELGLQVGVNFLEHGLNIDCYEIDSQAVGKSAAIGAVGGFVAGPLGGVDGMAKNAGKFGKAYQKYKNAKKTIADRERARLAGIPRSPRTDIKHATKRDRALDQMKASAVGGLTGPAVSRSLSLLDDLRASSDKSDGQCN